VREGLEAPFPPYDLSIYGLSEHFEGEMEMFSINGVYFSIACLYLTLNIEH
jgi:hypothetical protein